MNASRPCKLPVPRKDTGLVAKQHRIIILNNGFKMHVLVINPDASQTMMFLHGAGCSPDLLIDFLAASAIQHDVTIVAPYLPLHGVSDDVRSFDQMVGVLGEVADKLGLQNATLLGHSLGAFLLICLAESQPGLVASGVALAMPTKIHTQGVQYAATVPALTVDAFLTSNLAVMCSVFKGNFFQLSAAFCVAGSHLVLGDGHRLYEVLKGAPELRDIMPAVAQPIDLLFGGLDLAIRPVKFKISDNFRITVLPGMPHNFLWLPPSKVHPAVWPHLQDSLAIARRTRSQIEAASRAEAATLAEVIHLPVHPQGVAAS